MDDENVGQRGASPGGKGEVRVIIGIAEQSLGVCVYLGQRFCSVFSFLLSQKIQRCWRLFPSRMPDAPIQQSAFRRREAAHTDRISNLDLAAATGPTISKHAQIDSIDRG